RTDIARTGKRAESRAAAARDRVAGSVALEHARTRRRRIGQIGAIGLAQRGRRLLVLVDPPAQGQAEPLVEGGRRPGHLTIGGDRGVVGGALLKVVLVAAELEIPARVEDAVLFLETE